MYYFDKRLQYPVKVEKPDPIFARQLQQAIGGVEGEIRVCLQYFFQAWGARGPAITAISARKASSSNQCLERWVPK